MIIDMADDIWRWSAARIAGAIRDREISAQEALASCLARISQVNPKLNAVTVDLSNSARRAARSADEAVARGDPLGPLHGVPVTIKENVDQEGCATTNGVVGFQNIIAKSDSPIVANWKRAGAIIAGRTNTPAFSGRTYSPWSKAHTPGGSSGGASASVAAGMTPIAHGNDIAGSVRFPAYCCGLAGIRPSFGRVPAYNPTQTAERSMSSQLMSVQGLLGRSVADIRLGLAAMAGRDVRDPWWSPVPLAGPAVQKRVAIVTEASDLGGVNLHPHVAAAIRQAAAWLADAGYEIIGDRTPGFTRAKELWFEMQMPEFRHYMLPLIEKEGDQGIRSAVRYMLENFPETDVLAYMRLVVRPADHVAAEPFSRSSAAGARADSVGARLCTRLRRREWRANRSAVARVRDHDGGAGAGTPRDGGAHRPRRWPAHGRSAYRCAFSRGRVP